MDESRDRLHSTFSVNDWVHGPIAACPIEASLRRGGATTREARERGKKGGKREKRVERCWKRGGVGARALSFFACAGPKTGLSIPSVRNVRAIQILLSFARRRDDISILRSLPLKISSSRPGTRNTVERFLRTWYLGKGCENLRFGKAEIGREEEEEEGRYIAWNRSGA